MLEFFCGAPGSGKTREIYKRAEADAKNGKSVFILVPEQYSMFSEQELIQRLGLSAQNKIQILTFSRLSNMVFSRLGPLRGRYIDKAGKYLMACRAMQLSEKQLKLFARNASQPGFVGLITSAISEFKRYGVSPSALKDTAEKTDDAILKMKLTDLSVIYSKFDELVCEEHSNTEDSLALALPKIQDCNFLSGSIYVNFFRSFTPVEYNVLAELMKKCDLTVALCTNTLSEKSTVFSSQVYTFKKLKSLGEALGVCVKEPQFFTEEVRFKNNPELRHIKNSYLSYKPTPMNGEPQSVHIYRPDNRYNEVRKCAETIHRLCRTDGYSYKDFLILTGSMSDYELILPSVFEEFDISFFLDRKIKLSESPLMRMIISVLEILAYGFSYDRVMTIIRSGFWSIDQKTADIFENYILAADITHKQWNSLEPWTYNPGRASFDMELVNSAKTAVITPICQLINSFSGRKTVDGICKKLCDWFNGLNLHQTVSDEIQKRIDDNRHQQAEQLHRVWNSFVSLINQVSACMSDTYATFTDFYELFTAACGELSVGIVPTVQDAVIISEASRFRSTGAKVVMILGVLDKAFPRSHMAEGLLSDAERLRLSDAGLTLAPDAFGRQKEEQFLVYSALTTATEQLFLFSPISDREGKSLGSSEVLRQITALFPDIKPHTASSEYESIEGRQNTFTELSARLFEVGFNPESLTPLWKQIYEYFKDDPIYFKKLNALQKMSLHTDEPPKISKRTAERLYGVPLVLSVSKLEKYNSCAFSFFMRYGLFAEERLLGGIKATDTGSILHSVLCDYFKAKKDADYSKITRSECFADIANLVDTFAECNGNSLYTSSNYYGYIMLRLKNIAAATAWKTVKFYEQSTFRPESFEISFGTRGVLPPYEIYTENGKVYLEGFIDRVDKADIGEKTYISITDYKSSEKRIDPSLVDAGITIQPLIYANAVTGKSPDTEPAAMMYLQMNDPILKFDTAPTEEQWEAGMNDGIKVHGLFLDEPEVISAIDPDADNKNAIHYINCDKKSRLPKEVLSAKLESAAKCAASTADNILNGQISPDVPQISGFNPCAYCPYSSVCEEE